MIQRRLLIGVSASTFALAAGCASPDSTLPPPAPAHSPRVVASAQELVLVQLTGLT